MSEHIFVVLWIALCAVFGKYAPVKKTQLVDGVEEQRYTVFFAFLAILPLVLFAGFRNYNFGDTWVYVQNYRSTPTVFSEFNDYISATTKDKGFAVFTIIFKKIFGQNVQLYFLFIAFIQGICVFAFFYKYSVNYIFSMFLFIISASYAGWMFNGMRQFLAATIIVAATPLMLKKKYIPVIIIVLFASTIHQSALLMIPAVFISQGKVWNKKTLVFIFVILLTILFLDQFTNFLNDISIGTQYEINVDQMQDIDSSGTNPLRVIVCSVPTIISFIFRKKIREKNNQTINFCVNMSIICTGLYIISMFISAIQIGRLPGFMILYTFILLPWEFDNIFVENKLLMYYFSTIFYSVFYFYQMHFVWLLF